MLRILFSSTVKPRKKQLILPERIAINLISSSRGITIYMSPPFFSVVVPAHNLEKYIKECITSVLEQSFRDWELIVIDDGSSDHTSDILSSVNDDRLHIISIDNRGVSKARNLGIATAKGTYIAFLDGDDLWMNNHLHLAYHYLSEHEDTAWYSSRYVIGPDAKCLSHTHPAPIKAQPYFGTPSLHVHSSTVILKADQAKALLPLFPEHMRNAEDWAAWATYAEHHPLIAFTETQDVLYRQHAGSVTANSGEDALSRLYFALPNYWLGQRREEPLSVDQRLYYRYRTTQRWQLRISQMPIKHWETDLIKQRELLGFSRRAIIFILLKTIDLLAFILNKLLYIGSYRDERSIVKEHHQKII